MPHDFLTPPQVAREIDQPTWKIRRAVDSLGTIRRAGLVRLVPRALLPKVKAICLSRGTNRKSK